MATKHLFLIRHAKAEDYSFYKNDYDRNLVEKGISRAELIANKLKSHTHNPDKTLVISSSANRAIQTAQIFCNIIGYPLENIQQEKSIYEAYYKEILKVINQISRNVDTVIVFGHNPGLSDLTNYICDTYIDLKTAHVAKISLLEDFDFNEISENTGILDTLITE